MASKTFNSRIILKHDIEENWNKATNFVPLLGEVIIYDPDENYNYSRTKIGDGSHTVVELPFELDPIISSMVGEKTTGNVYTINDTDVTAAEGSEIFNDYENNIASGKYSHAENYNTIAKGSYSHAEGYGTLAAGAASHAEGYDTKAPARYSHAEGASTTASGNNSHAEGNNTTSSGHYSHAEGNFTTAAGGYSHAEGNYAQTGEDGTYAHAEGSYTKALKTGAHAEGNYTEANAAFAHTEGYYTKASSPYQHVRGKYNIADDTGTYATIIGNGDADSNRKNIHTLDWNGNAWYAGTVKIGGTSYADASEVALKSDFENIPDDLVLYTEQELTDEQKAQVRDNIGAGIPVIIDTELTTSGAAADALAVGTRLAEHTHTYESVEGLEDVIGNIADAKFYVVTFERGDDNKYHADLTFAEIREKFEGGGNMVARIDGTDYIPLLSAAPHQIIFSGIYNTQSVSLTINANEVCTLTTTQLANSSHSHSAASTTTNGFMSKDDKTKLNNIEANAEVNIIESISVNGEELAITDKAVDISIPEQKQADWNQSDETAVDYIKNRTHWVKRAETLLDSEVFDCTTLTEDSESYYCTKSGNIGLINGNKYIVTVDGTEYTTSALAAFGTNDVALIAEIDKCRIYDRENGVVEVFTNSSASLTISIVDAEDIYIKLDERFIPDVFARSTDIELKMAKENPTGTGALSINRASGSEVGENSIAIGTDCVASGDSAVAIGSGVSATGFASHAEGTGTVASGNLAHAEGQDSQATGYASHAESSGEANGDYSHAEGYGIADGNYSHASGNGTWAVGRSQTVIGEANLEDSAADAATRGTYAVIVGNGDIDAGEYSNASTLDWDGNGWFAGGLKVGGTGQDDEAAVNVVLETDIITVDEIDAICGAVIVSGDEVEL